MRYVTWIDGAFQGGSSATQIPGWTSNQFCILLLIVGAAGGVGGLCAGFNYKSKNALIMPLTGAEIRTGFLGDVFIGQVAALASVLLLSIAEYDMLEVLSKLGTLMKFASLCAVAGFAGLRLMRSLSRGLLEQMGEQVESVEKEVDVLRKVSGLLIEAAYMRVKGKHREEAQFCTEAIGLDPINEEALIGLAVAKSLIDEPANLEEASNILIRVVKDINPHSARAFYNLACIGNLMASKYTDQFGKHELTGAVLTNLATAIRLSPAYRSYALDDPDWDNMKGTDDFKRVVS